MLNKQPVPINFGQGLNTKTDPHQVPVGQFLSLQNSIFDELGLLKKRNGFGDLTALPNPASFLTTFNGALTAIGPTLQAYSPSSSPWVTTGSIQPLSLNTLPLIRNSVNQSQSDSATSTNGLICTVYTETTGASTGYKYAIADSATGQSITQPKAIPVSSGTVTGSPRVFILGNYFVVVFTNIITAVSHLQYISISIVDPTVVTANSDIASSYAAKTGLSWDGVVVGSNLYLAYNTTTGGQSIKVTYLSSANASMGSGPVTAVTFAAQICTIMSICADVSIPQSPIIYAAYYDSVSGAFETLAVDQNLNTVLAPTGIISVEVILNLTCTAQNGVCTIFYEVQNNYSYDASIASHYVSATTCTQAGVFGPPHVVAKSIGLASKAFIINSVMYFLAEYQSLFQPTYFLMNGSTSTSAAPKSIAKLAYQNGYVNPSATTQGYLPTGLPSATVSGSSVEISYLYKDLIQSVSKENTAIASTAQNPLQTSNIYSQTGINLVTFNLGTTGIDTAEIGSNLNITGGFLSGYDGYQTTEQNFFLWPDSIECTWSATGGSMVAQPDGSTNAKAYWYQVTYEWTDNQGNIQRSAPSIPVAVTTTGIASTGSVTVNVPYLRLTYKTQVKIVVYRWSVGQQDYFQTTSITQPQINNTTTDSLAYLDTNADSTILGNNLIYTTGAVIENVNAPSSDLMTLFDDRLWLVDSEDRNLLWFSKQVIEATPVEMSDLFTFYVAPTTGAQGSTGVITAISVMDDKLIIFKKDAIYYINGVGPDNTGSNNQYNGPIFITSTVGCSLQQSVVFTPNGLLFQSDKGIWQLGRDLSVTYVGAPVEDFTQAGIAVSSLGIPGTNQVRFTMSTGITLMYDYYVGQWGTFVGIPGLSSTLYQGLHTFINKYGQVLQETPGKYLDGTNPVLLSLETSEFNLGGLQGYQRIFFFYLLGTYISPHKLNVQIAYDYESAPSEQVLISPNNYTPAYGGDNVYGQSTPYGGPGSLERWRVFTQRQRCQSFRVYISEVYDPSFGTVAGAGLTLSGLNCIVGIKKGYRPTPSATSVGLSS